MKLKEYFYLLGIKPGAKRYGYQVKQFQINSVGTVSYAQWQHPAEDDKYITEENITLLQSFIDPGDFCIDIGAHSGDTTIPMALAAGTSGFVLALEPNPFVFTVLNKNTSLNTTLTNILPLMIAVTEKDEDIDFEYSDSGFCNGGYHENVSKWKHGNAFSLTVTGLNLSDLLHRKFPERLPRLKFIKVDTEGYDLSVIKSFSHLIDQYKPYIKAEIYKFTDQNYREEMHTFFTTKGYSIYKVKDEHNYKEELLSINDMMRWKHYDIFCVPSP